MDAKVLAKAISTFSEIIRGRKRWDEQKHELLRQCQSLFSAEVCAIFLVRGREVVLEGHIGYTKYDGTEIPFETLKKGMTYKFTPERDGAAEPFDGITGQVASTGKEFSIDDPGQRSDMKSHRGGPDLLKIWHPEKRPFRCMFTVPLKIGDNTIGALKVENKRDASGKEAVFDDVDKEVMRALANFFSIAVKLSYFRGLPYNELITITTDWLEKFDRRNLYQNMVEFCATLFKADVCALFVRTDKIDGNLRVALAAGRMPDGGPMDPKKFFESEIDSTYLIGKKDNKYDGVTGKIAATGAALIINKFPSMKNEEGHKGKWDQFVWGGKPNERFLCMIGVPLIAAGEQYPIGVLKVERKTPENPEDIETRFFTGEDLDILTSIADGFAKHIYKLIQEGEELRPEGDYEYRLIRSAPQTFERKQIGEVIIRHLMTSICKSDIYYFNHEKDRKKLDERLPMAIGHETVGEIIQAGPDARYFDSKDKIRTGDKVVVIPLMPCGTCHVCTGDYGENYCPSSRFMASNAPGSLRSSYQYDANLILKIDDNIPEHLALFTEPMSNVVQMINELGFVEKENRIDLDMRPFDEHDFFYFHVQDERFTNVFNTITAEEPNPRTLFLLKNPDPKIILGKRRISHANIMTKGLGLLGVDDMKMKENYRKRMLPAPKILILGSGISAYLIAILLRYVYDIPESMITVTGRSFPRLNQYVKVAQSRINVRPFEGKENELVDDLLAAGAAPGRPFDVVFECVGYPAVENNIRIALKVLNRNGVLAFFGLTDKNIEIDFSTILAKEIYIKGVYRGSLGSYQKSMDFIRRYPAIRSALEEMIDKETEIRGNRGFHDVGNEEHLADVFKKAGEKKEQLGRIVIRKLLYSQSRDAAPGRASGVKK